MRDVRLCLQCRAKRQNSALRSLRRDSRDPSRVDLFGIYDKPDKSPQLLARHMADTDDLHIPMSAAEFLAKAWKLANQKAREIGWIV
jgi:hypothetical protein